MDKQQFLYRLDQFNFSCGDHRIDTYVDELANMWLEMATKGVAVTQKDLQDAILRLRIPESVLPELTRYMQFINSNIPLIVSFNSGG